MAIKSSGQQLKFSEIEKEFGENPGRSLGRYRSSHPNFKNENLGALSNLPLDTGIPTGINDEIRFSQFYSKRLNIVVDLYSGVEENRKNAKTEFQNGNAKVVGGYKTLPSKTKGSSVKIHVNKVIGSEKGNQQKCAVRTGSWNNDTHLFIDIGSSGRLFGAGGNGGNGGTGTEDGKDGGNGSSALGIEYTGSQSGGTTVNLLGSNSKIQCGFAGGGGGGGGYADPDKNSEDHASGGGGGGGGAGLPAGAGGSGGGSFGKGDDGGDGNDGTKNNGGSGGSGGSGGESAGGDGGNGGDPNDSAGGGAEGEGNVGKGDGGGTGSNGAAIRKASGVTFQIGTNNGTITGSTNQTGVS